MLRHKAINKKSGTHQHKKSTPVTKPKRKTIKNRKQYRSMSTTTQQQPDMASVLQRPDLFQQNMFINNTYISPKNGKTSKVIDPGNQTIIGEVANCEIDDVRDAINAAEVAFSSWKNFQPYERASLIGKLNALITQNQDDLALILARETGKPLAEAIGEVKYGNAYCDYYSKHGPSFLRPQNIQHARTGDLPTTIVLEHVPIGVSAAAVAWNLPFALALRKIAPALVAGCTIVVKPSSTTPFSTLALGQLIKDAGIPPGVVEFVTGEASVIGEEFATNEKIKKISFTGSTSVGAKLMQQSAPQIKRVSMELGGNAPFIVLNDVTGSKMDDLVNNAITGAKLRNNAQTCVSANRFLIHENVAEEFATKLTTRFEKLKLGYGLDDGVEMGPLHNKKAVEHVEDVIQDAITKGATLRIGGKRRNIKSTYGESDLFFEPTILTNCTKEMKVWKDEIFGPVVPIFTFQNNDDVAALANDTNAGLAAYIFSQDDNAMAKIVRNLDFGMVACNQGTVSSALSPFGGLKHSGMGKEGGPAGILPYVDIKAIHYYEPDIAKMKK